MGADGKGDRGSVAKVGVGASPLTLMTPLKLTNFFFLASKRKCINKDIFYNSNSESHQHAERRDGQLIKKQRFIARVVMAVGGGRGSCLKSFSGFQPHGLIRKGTESKTSRSYTKNRLLNMTEYKLELYFLCMFCRDARSFRMVDLCMSF